MKLYKYNLLILGMIAAVLSSCGDPDDAVFSGKSNEQTLITMDQTSLDLGVINNDQGSIEVQVDVTTKTDTDRSFDIALVDSITDDTPNMDYDFDNSVVIPAGEFTGSFTVTGVDQGLTDEEYQLGFIIDKAETESVKLESEIARIKAQRICPIPEDFLVGQYEVEDVSAGIGPAQDPPQENIVSGTVNVKIGKTSTDRVFTVNVIGGSSKEIKLSFVCGKIKFSRLDLGIYCTQGTPYVWDEATNNTTYDVQQEQDSYTIKYQEDPEGSCGGPFESSFSLTKVQ